MKFKYILFTIILALTLFACNKAESENEYTISNNNIESNYSLPDSIIDAGIIKYTIRRLSGGVNSYFKKGYAAHERYRSLQLIDHLKNKINSKEIYSEALHYYSLSISNNEIHKELALQNRASLKLNFGDYYGAIVDYDSLLNKEVRYQNELLLLKAFCHLKVGDIDKSEELINKITNKYIEKSHDNEGDKTISRPNKFGFKADLPDRTVDRTFLASAFYYNGVINYIKGNKIVACQSWSKASELNEDVSIYATLEVIQGYCK